MKEEFHLEEVFSVVVTKMKETGPSGGPRTWAVSRCDSSLALKFVSNSFGWQPLGNGGGIQMPEASAGKSSASHGSKRRKTAAKMTPRASRRATAGTAPWKDELEDLESDSSRRWPGSSWLP